MRPLSGLYHIALILSLSPLFGLGCSADNDPAEARLAAGETRVELAVNGHRKAAVMAPTWDAAGPLGAARWYHTATLLPSGDI